MAQFKQEYFISQSISGSFLKDDVANISFRARRAGNPVDGLSFINFCDLWACESSSSFQSSGFGGSTNTNLMHTQFSLPVSKGSATGSYGEKSFVSKITPAAKYEVLTVLISGSVIQESTEHQTSASKTDLHIDYDNFEITIEQPKVELVPAGFLAYTGPKRYVKIGTDGEVTIKGGEIEAQKIVAGELEVYGDVSLFGDIQAGGGSDPYNDTPENIVSGEGTSLANDGSSTQFARGDHVHALPFTTLAEVMNNGLFSSVSSSVATLGVGTFNNTVAKFVAPGGAPDTTAVEVSGTLDVTGDLIARNFITINQTTINTTLSDGSTVFGNTGDDIHHHTGSIHQSGSDNNFFKGKMWIGSATGSHSATQFLTVAGDISASGDLYVDDDIILNNTSMLGFTDGLNLQFNNDDGGDDGLVIRNVGSALHVFEEGGDVGIGHTDPQSKLDVYGKVRSDAGTYAVELDGQDSSGPRINWGGTTDTDQYMIMGAFGGFNNINSTTRDFHIYGGTHATGAFFDVSTNRWGFGENTPTHMLSLRGDTTSFLKFDRQNASATASVSFDLTRAVSNVQGRLDMTLGDDTTDYRIDTPTNTLFFVSSSGRVGIGTLTPGEELEVSGDISASGAIRAANIGITNIVTGYVPYHNGTQFDDSVIYNDNVNSRIGIGTASPGAKLHVYGDGNLNGLFQGSSTVNYVQFQDSNTGLSSNTNNGTTVGTNTGVFLINNRENKNIQFATNDTTRMVIKNDGNVGIGVASPLTKFQVDGIISGSDVLDLQDNKPIRWNQRSGIRAEGDTLKYIAAGSGHHIFRTNTSDPLMYIKNDGNIGFGHEAADHILHFKYASAGTKPVMKFETTDQSTYTLRHGTSGLYFCLGTTLLAGFEDGHDFGVFDDAAEKYVKFDGSKKAIGFHNSSLKSWDEAYAVMQFGGRASISAYTASDSRFILSDNAYTTTGGTFKRINAGYASQIFMEDGIVRVKTAGSDTSDSTISFHNTLTVNGENGYVGVNRATPTDARLQVHGSISGSSWLNLGKQGTAADSASTYASAQIRLTPSAWDSDGYNTDQWHWIQSRGISHTEKLGQSQDLSPTVLEFGRQNEKVALQLQTTYSPNHTSAKAGSNLLLLHSGSFGIGALHNPMDSAYTPPNMTTSSGSHAILVQGGQGHGGNSTAKYDSGIFLRRFDSNTGLDLWQDASNGYNYIDNRWSSGQVIFRNKTAYTAVETMRIDASGNLGIGTDSPAHKLEVKGPISTLARFYNESNGSQGEIEIGTMDIYVDNNVMKLRNASDAAWLTLSGSRVGIGTNTPNQPLEVVGNISGSDRLYLGGNTIYSDSSDAILRFMGYGSAGVKVQTSGLIVSGNYTDGRNAWNSMADSGQEAAYFGGDVAIGIHNNGKLGLGTATPSAHLHILTDGGTDPNIFVSGTNSGHIFDAKINNDQRFRIDNSGNINFSVGTTSAKVWNMGSGGVSISSNSQTKDLFVASSGNVGIGTATPQAKLHVSGTLFIHSGSVGAHLGAGSYIPSGDNWQHVMRLGTADAKGFDVLIEDGGTGQYSLYTGRWGAKYHWYRGSEDKDGSGNTTHPIAKLEGSDTATAFALYDGISNVKKVNLVSTGSTSTYFNYGNVGIGTDNPQYNLDVYESSGNGMIRAYGSSIGRLSLQNSTRHYSTSVQGNKWYFYDETGGNTVMVMDSDGKVGIGTSSPETLLDVTGSLTIGEKIYTRADGNRNTYIGSGTDKWSFWGGATKLAEFELDENAWIKKGLEVDGDITASGNITAESLGLSGAGTNYLEIKSTNENAELRINAFTNNDARIKLFENDVLKWNLYNDGSDSDAFKIADTDETLVKIEQSGDVWIKNNLDVDGDIKARNYITETTTVNNIIINQSGSTRFGDTLDDTHIMTGSLKLTGSFEFETTADNRVFKSNGTSGVALQDKSGDGWAMIYGAIDSTDGDYGGFGIHGGTNTFSKFFIGRRYDKATVEIYSGSKNELLVKGDIASSGSLTVDGNISSSGEMYLSKEGGRLDVGANTKISGQFKNNNNTEFTYLKMYNGSNGSINMGSKHSLGYISFEVGNASYDERMRITNDGNVGIGTTTPKSRLEVYNAATYSVEHSASDFDSDSIGLYGSVGSANGDYFGGITWHNGIRRRAGIASVMEEADADYVGLAFFTQGTDGNGPMAESMRLSRAGYLGIGTTTPTAKLTVGSSANYVTPSSDASEAVFYGTGGNGGISILSELNNGESNILFGYDSSTHTNDGQIKFQNSSTGTSQAMYFKVNDANALKIDGSQVLSLYQYLNINNVASDKKISFNRTGGNTFSIEHDASRIYFYNSAATINTHPIVINNDGKVGIGTTSMVASGLEVQGELGISDGSGAVHTQLYREADTGGITFKRVNNSDGSDNGGDFLHARYGELRVIGDISASNEIYSNGNLLLDNHGTNSKGQVLFKSAEGNWNHKSGSMRKNSGGGLRIGNNKSIIMDLFDPVAGSSSFLVYDSSGYKQFGVNTAGNVHIPSGSMTINGNIDPIGDNQHDLGTPTARWQDLYAVKTTTGGIYEAGLETKGLKDLPIGTLVVWKDGKCVPCNKYADELVMGVAGEKDEPIILGAEPILVTGDVKIGEYIITSNVEGHGESIDSEYLLQRNLYGKVIGQALESAEGDSSLIKCMIRKM